MGKQGWRLENSTYPKAGRLGNDFTALFSDELMARYCDFVDAGREIEKEAIRLKLADVKTMLSNAVMLICAVIIFSYVLAAGIVAHDVQLWKVALPAIAYVLGVQLINSKANDTENRKPDTYLMLLRDGLLMGFLVAFVTLACFSLIEIGKLMR